jgi:hypothetical protein
MVANSSALGLRNAHLSSRLDPARGVASSFLIQEAPHRLRSSSCCRELPPLLHTELISTVIHSPHIRNAHATERAQHPIARQQCGTKCQRIAVVVRVEGRTGFAKPVS